MSIESEHQPLNLTSPSPANQLNNHISNQFSRLSPEEVDIDIHVEDHFIMVKHQWSPRFRNCFIFMVFIILASISVCIYEGIQLQKQRQLFSLKNNNKQINQYQQLRQQFPKIIWLMRKNSYEAADLTTTLHLNNIKQFSNSYEVRYLTSMNFYDYLSEEASSHITKIMQTKIQRYLIYQLAILYVLLENGGIYINHEHVILTAQIEKWLQKIVSYEQANILQNQQDLTSNKLHKSLMFLFHKESQINSKLRGFQSYFIAVQKKNHLIQQIINHIEIKASNKHSKDNFNSSYNSKITIVNENEEWMYFNRFIQEKLLKESQKTSLQVVNRKDIDKLVYFKLNIISVNAKNGPQRYNPFHQKRLAYFLTENSIKNVEKRVGNYNFLLYLNQKQNQKLREIENQVIENSDMTGLYNQDSYLMKFYLKINQSWNLLENKQNVREKVHFCLISLKSIPSSNHIDFQENIKQLSIQSYSQWNAVFFQEQIQQKTHLNPQITIFPSEGNVGKNAHAAIMHYCPLQSVILLLDFDQKLADNHVLKDLAQLMVDKSVFGSLVGLINTENATFFNFKGVDNFKRHQYFTEERTQFSVLANIYHHFRVFDSNLYRVHPSQDLNDMQIFYENKLSFLVGILSFKQHTIDHFYEKKYYQRFNFPKKLGFIRDRPLIRLKNLSKIDMKEIPAISRKTAYPSFLDILRHSQHRGISLNRYLPEEKVISFINKTKSLKKQRIPKIIHHIWIGTIIPPMKQAFIDQTAKFHPEYKVKIWRKENITKENFPYMYNVLKQLMEVELLVDVRKQAQFTDLMRFQILYHHGGFYTDTNYQFFTSCLDKFVDFKFFIVAEQSTVSNVAQNMCILGAEPGNQNIKRLILPRNTNQFDFYEHYVIFITGPHNFRQTLTLEDEYDPDIIHLSFQKFFPYFPWIKTEYSTEIHDWSINDLRFKIDKCIIQFDPSGPLPIQKQKVKVIQNNKIYMINCQGQYPDSYGMEHYAFGGNWMEAKVKK